MIGKHFKTKYIIQGGDRMDRKVSLLHQDLVFIDYEAKDREDLLSNLCKILIDKGYVKESFLAGILEREKTFPTGLITEGIQVAIPHTDAKHVNHSAILIAKLKEPIIFKEMSGSTEDVAVSLVFMLAIKNPQQQIETLSKFMKIFSDGEILKSIHASLSSSEVIEKLELVIGESPSEKTHGLMV